MRDRAVEERHLAEADRHISEGEQRASELEATISEAVASGQDTDQARATLESINETLAIFREGRTLILQTIADIDAGRL